jgi:hypothetical protein
MNTVPSIMKSLSLILSLAGVSLPVVSLAGDTDPNGVKLMLLHEEPKFKADLIEKTGDAENTDWITVCSLEAITGVGLAIWDNRRSQDSCLRVQSFASIGYCVYYSDRCPHYSWDPNCLLDKMGTDYCGLLR